MNIDFKFYALVFLRRLHYFLLVFILIAAAGLTVAVILPPTYRAQALLLLEAQQIPRNLAQSTVGTNQIEQVETVRRRLVARENILDLANRLDLYDDQPDMTPSAIVGDLRSRISFDYTSGGRNQPVTMAVSATAGNGEEAAEIANELVTLLLQENAELRTDQASGTLQFFQQEVDRLGQDLDVKAAEILTFKTNNIDALPESLDFRRNRMISLQQRLNQIEREISSEKARRDRMVTFYENTGRLENETANMSPVERELQQARQDREVALLTFSEQHPNVQALNNKIAALETQVGAAQGQDASSSPQSEFEFQLSEIDRDLGELEDERANIETEISEISDAIDNTPANAIQLSELERSYSNTQSLYNQAVSRLAAAQTGERIELTSKGQRISVIEQATAPGSPASPPRKLIAAGSVAMGIFAGLGLVVLLELLNRSIQRPITLTNKLGITPLATIPYIRTSREVKIRSTLITGSFIFALVAIPVGLYLANTYISPLDALAYDILQTLRGLIGQA